MITSKKNKMFCHNCGNKVIGNFCTNCGTKTVLADSSVEGGAEVTSYASATPLNLTDWKTETNLENLVKYPEIRTLLKKYAEESPEKLTANEFINLVDLAYAPAVGISLKKISDVMMPVYQKWGLKVGKSDKRNYKLSIQEVTVKSLCSLAKNGYPLSTIERASDGLVITAKLPSDMWSWEGTLIITIEEGNSFTTVAIDAKIKGQLYDWGKTKKAVNKVFDDIQGLVLNV